MLWSLGLTGLGYTLTTVFITEMAMGFFPFIFALVGGAHQDFRFRRGNGGQLNEAQSSVPFAALISGTQSWVKLNEEIKWTNAVIGVAMAAMWCWKTYRRRNIHPVQLMEKGIGGSAT